MDDKFCTDCIYCRGEECNGPGGAPEGKEIYGYSKACDCYEEIEAPEIVPWNVGRTK